MLLNRVLLTPRFQGDFLSAINSAETIVLLKKKKKGKQFYRANFSDSIY